MFAPSSRRLLATALAAAQLFAVAHLALVPHTAGHSGGTASTGHSIEEHLDAVAHAGPHAHAPAPAPREQGEEHCAVLAMLSASSNPPAPEVRVLAAVESPRLTAFTDSPYAPSRRERLLSAPKASPPASPLV